MIYNEDCLEGMKRIAWRDFCRARFAAMKFMLVVTIVNFVANTF